MLRWVGENVKAVLVPQSVFLTNAKGYPVLPKRHQAVLAMLMSRGAQVVFCPDEGSALPPAVAQAAVLPAAGAEEGQGEEDGDAGPRHPHSFFHDYLSFLFRKIPAPSDRELPEISYRDYLQHPLQPLQDNLECSTYEVFEHDRAKYVQYEEAIYRALLDRVGDSEAASRTVVLMVVGAGRGPLVSRRSRLKT